MRLMRMRIVIARGLYRRWSLLLFLSLAGVSTLLIYIQNTEDSFRNDVISVHPSTPFPVVNTPDDYAYLVKKYSRSKPGLNNYVTHENHHHKTVNSTDNLSNITITVPGGRMGNNLFAYASLLGIANMRNKIPIMPPNTYLKEYFEISTPELSQPASEWKPFTEKLPCAYDFRVEEVDSSVNINLRGYFQSWKYFGSVEDELRRQLTFRKPIRKMAISFLRNAIHEKLGANISRSDVVLVGLHVRETDMTEYSNRLKGYKTADLDYIQGAMSYFEALYKNILFVVCSDNIFWSRVNIRGLVGAPVVFSEDHHAVVDLAILSLCDHSIITVGTFGWWAAWLAGGTTIYYSDYPNKHSLLYKQFVADDYFYPDWIGLPFPRNRGL